MLPARFDYLAPASLEEALSILAERGEDAKVMAGGQSLIPLMKLRLAQPAVLGTAAASSSVGNAMSRMNVAVLPT